MMKQILSKIATVMIAFAMVFSAMPLSAQESAKTFVDEFGVLWIVTGEVTYMDEEGNLITETSYERPTRGGRSQSGKLDVRNSLTHTPKGWPSITISYWVTGTLNFDAAADIAYFTNINGGHSVTGGLRPTGTNSVTTRTGNGVVFGIGRNWAEVTNTVNISGLTGAAAGDTISLSVSVKRNSEANK